MLAGQPKGKDHHCGPRRHGERPCDAALRARAAAQDLHAIRAEHRHAQVEAVDVAAPCPELAVDRQAVDNPAERRGRTDGHHEAEGPNGDERPRPPVGLQRHQPCNGQHEQRHAGIPAQLGEVEDAPVGGGVGSPGQRLAEQVREHQHGELGGREGEAHGVRVRQAVADAGPRDQHRRKELHRREPETGCHDEQGDQRGAHRPGGPAQQGSRRDVDGQNQQVHEEDLAVPRQGRQRHRHRRDEQSPRVQSFLHELVAVQHPGKPGGAGNHALVADVREEERAQPEAQSAHRGGHPVPGQAPGQQPRPEAGDDEGRDDAEVVGEGGRQHQEEQVGRVERARLAAAEQRHPGLGPRVPGGQVPAQPRPCRHDEPGDEELRPVAGGVERGPGEAPDEDHEGGEHDRPRRAPEPAPRVGCGWRCRSGVGSRRGDRCGIHRCRDLPTAGRRGLRRFSANHVAVSATPYAKSRGPARRRPFARRRRGALVQLSSGIAPPHPARFRHSPSRYRPSTGTRPGCHRSRSRRFPATCSSRWSWRQCAPTGRPGNGTR